MMLLKAKQPDGAGSAELVGTRLLVLQWKAKKTLDREVRSTAMAG